MKGLARRRSPPDTPTAAPGPSAGASTFVVFSVDGVHYAAPVSSVRRTLQFPTVTRLPAVAPTIAGVFQHAGRLITLFDLRAVLAAGNDPPTHPWVLVVEADGHTRGLLVDAVTDVLTLPGATIGAAAAPPPKEARPAVRGVLVAGPATDEDMAGSPAPGAVARPLDPEEAERRTRAASRAALQQLDPVYLVDIVRLITMEATP